MPLPILHPKLQPYYLSIFERPQDTLRELYTILEQHLKQSSNVDSHETNYIEKAFRPQKGTAKLSLARDDGQQDGFKFLVKGLTQLHRNQIMHNPNSNFHHKQHNIISEFMLINHIFRLSDYIVKNDELESQVKN